MKNNSKKSIKITESFKEKLMNLNKNFELKLLQSVTNKYIKKIKNEISILELKKVLKEEIKRTNYIYLNNEKIKIEYNHPSLTETIFFCNKCLNISYSLINYKQHDNICKSFYGLLSYKGVFNNDNQIEIRQIDGLFYSSFSYSLTKLGRYFFIDKSLDSLLEYFYLFTLIVNNKLVGYFSMDKLFQNCNISCIVIFPPYRSYKYSYLLIDFSYKIFLLNNKVASPERPLSNGGKIVFKRYWRYIIYNLIKSNNNLLLTPSFISKSTGIIEEDVKETLNEIIINGILIPYEDIIHIEILKSNSISLMIESNSIIN